MIVFWKGSVLEVTIHHAICIWVRNVYVPRANNFEAFTLSMPHTKEQSLLFLLAAVSLITVVHSLLLCSVLLHIPLACSGRALFVAFLPIVSHIHSYNLLRTITAFAISPLILSAPAVHALL
jgi:hypothetical protein